MRESKKSKELTIKFEDYYSQWHRIRRARRDGVDVDHEMGRLADMYREIVSFNKIFKLRRECEFIYARASYTELCDYFDRRDLLYRLEQQYTPDQLNDLESNYTVKPDHDNEGQSRPVL